MQKIYTILFVLLLICAGCEWHLRSNEESQDADLIERYDLVEAHFLTTGDIAALQQMNTDYPQQTRMLIEDILQLGHVNDSGINIRFYQYFQDSVLQMIVDEVALQYADLSDVNRSLSTAFERMQQMLPDVKVPQVYTQIGSLDQSIVVGNGMLGISLDKYLGSDYPIYVRYGYDSQQRVSMSRVFIVPDCLLFYLLSVYPYPGNLETATHEERNRHLGAIQYVVNQSTGHPIYKNDYVDSVETRLEQEQGLTLEKMLR